MVRLGALLFAVLFFSACGDDAREASRPSAAPADVAALVPAGADIVVRIESLDRLGEVFALAAEFAGKPVPGDPAAQLVGMSGVAPGQFDRTKPCYVAVTMPAGMPMPVPTLIVPVKDPAAVVAAYPGATKESRGSYVALSRMAGLRLGDNGLCDDLPEGDLVLRLDLASLAAKYGARIEQGLAALESGGPAAGALPMAWMGGLTKSVAEGARDVVESAERLDIVVRANDPEIAVDVAFVAKDGSALATRESAPAKLREFAASVPSDAAMVALFCFDAKAVVDMATTLVEGSVTAPTPEQQKQMEENLAKARASVEGLGREWLVAADVNEDGLRLLASGRVRDATAYVKRWESHAAAVSVPGMEVTVAGRRKAGDAEVLRLDVVVDPETYAAGRGRSVAVLRSELEAFFGGPKVPVEIATRGDRVFATVGQKAERALEADGSLGDALGNIRGSLAFYVALDLPSLARGLAQRGLDAPPGGPAYVEVFGARDGRTYKGGLRVRADAPKQAAAGR